MYAQALESGVMDFERTLMKVTSDSVVFTFWYKDL